MHATLPSSVRYIHEKFLYSGWASNFIHLHEFTGAAAGHCLSPRLHSPYLSIHTKYRIHVYALDPCTVHEILPPNIS
jgi:hypothetical protein